jgi:hypothetical protein
VRPEHRPQSYAELTERADPLIFKAMSWPALSYVVFAAIALPGQTSGPAATAVSYRSMQGATYDLHPWVGRNVALLTSEFKRSILVDLLNSYLATPDLNWQNTLLIGKAPPNPNDWSASDLAAGMFYRIYSDFGWEKYKAFWKAMSQLPKANTPYDTVGNFLSAAITSTGSDYQFLFKAARAHPSNRFP